VSEPEDIMIGGRWNYGWTHLLVADLDQFGMHSNIEVDICGPDCLCRFSQKLQMQKKLPPLYQTPVSKWWPEVEHDQPQNPPFSMTMPDGRIFTVPVKTKSFLLGIKVGDIILHKETGSLALVQKVTRRCHKPGKPAYIPFEGELPEGCEECNSLLVLQSAVDGCRTIESFYDEGFSITFSSDEEILRYCCGQTESSVDASIELLRKKFAKEEKK
jgi:hypothetical protein